MTDQNQTPATGEQPNINHASAWANALTGDPNAIFNWRFIHDQDKATPAIKRRGTLAQIWLEACDWNAKGYGIFATVNEMDGAGYDADGRPLPNVSGDTLEHVAGVRAHVVDLDNLAAMQNLARAEQHSIRPSFIVQTSPGKAHVYWSVQPAPGPVDLSGYRALQRKLRQLYDGDKAVVDATRVLRVPGFYHRKGQPHLVTVRASTGYGATVPAEWLALSVAHVNAVDDGGGRHPLGDPALAAPSAEWAKKALELTDPNSLNRTSWVSFTAAWKQAAWTVMDADAAREQWLNWCERYATNDPPENLKQWNSINDTEIGWKSLLRQNPALNGAFMFHGSQHEPLPAQSINDAIVESAICNQTHHDMAVAFAFKHQGQFLYNHDCAKWMKWDGIKWTEIPKEAMLSYVRTFCTNAVSFESRQPRSWNFWDGTLKALSATLELHVSQSELDWDNYLLNTPAGVIDLRTNAVRQVRREDRFAKATKVAPGPSNGEWPNFLQDIFASDQETIRSIQIMCGSFLSGGIEEETFYFLSGAGRNGKSKFMEAISFAMGDYAGIADSKVIATQRNEQHPTGLTDFAGLRLVTANEVAEGSFFNVDVLKMLTGDKEIRARRMAQDYFTFKRTSKLVILGNSKPQLRSTDIAIRARLRIIPFTQSYVGREDRGLADRLQADAPGILQWLLDGHAAWMAGGRTADPSPAIRLATDAYFKAQSTPDMWLEECADVIPLDPRPAKILPKAGEVYRNYRDWKVARGEQAISMTRFGEWISGVEGVEKVTHTRGILYRGLQFRPEFDLPEGGNVLFFSPGQIPGAMPPRT